MRGRDVDFDGGLKGLFGVVGASVAWAWAPLPDTVKALLLLMTIDIISGIVAAWALRRVDSTAGWRGIGRKALTLGVIALAAVAEPWLGGVPAAKVVAGYYCAIEGISILENAARAGVPVPAVLTDALMKVRLAGERPPDDPKPAPAEGR